jgi:hypothetical protein
VTDQQAATLARLIAWATAERDRAAFQERTTRYYDRRVKFAERARILNEVLKRMEGI